MPACSRPSSASEPSRLSLTSCVSEPTSRPLGFQPRDRSSCTPVPSSSLLMGLSHFGAARTVALAVTHKRETTAQATERAFLQMLSLTHPILLPDYFLPSNVQERPFRRWKGKRNLGQSKCFNPDRAGEALPTWSSRAFTAGYNTSFNPERAGEALPTWWQCSCACSNIIRFNSERAGEAFPTRRRHLRSLCAAAVSIPSGQERPFRHLTNTDILYREIVFQSRAGRRGPSDPDRRGYERR
jgi:hypothetical protein